jgi:glycerol-3-phosphate O-acyltransferase
MTLTLADPVPRAAARGHERRKLARHLSLLYAPAAPEFFDKSLFRGFIGKLRELKLVWICPDGKLDIDERLGAWEKDAKLVLSRELRHTITKISPEAVGKVAAPSAGA